MCVSLPKSSALSEIGMKLKEKYFHLVVLVGNQLEAQFLYNIFFESSTCFEQPCAHPQEDNCINTPSGIITLKTREWSKITEITRIHRSCNATTMYSSYFSNFRPLTCFQSDYTRWRINTIVLLRMSTGLLETCRGFK
jgi:hypothetical protein